MSFIQGAFAERPLLPQEEIARQVHSVSVSRGLDEFASILALMCIRQESNFWCPWNRKDPTSQNYPHDSESDDGRSVGYFQQQNKVAGENPTGPGENWWGPMSQRMDLKLACNEFLKRLDDGYRGALGHPLRCAQLIDNVQSSYWNGDPAHPGYYGKHYDYCWSLLKRALGNAPIGPTPEPIRNAPSILPNPGWRGDPLWLPEVLRLFGVDVYEAAGARERGHGDFGKISWVLWHHTGNRNETERGITNHPSLGLAANMLVFPNGRTCITGFGVAWHGGKGIYPGIPEDGINQVSIGIECAHSGTHGDPWPDVQMEAMIRIGAAIKWFLELPIGNQIAHKEWAGNENPLGINKQGKPDPVDINMGWFRDQIARRAADGPIGEDGMPLVNQPSGSIYRESNAVLPWAGTPMDFVIDAQNHEARVETLAQKGFPKALELVRAVANGTSPVSSSLSEQDRQHAQSILDYIESMA